MRIGSFAKGFMEPLWAICVQLRSEGAGSPWTALQCCQVAFARVTVSEPVGQSNPRQPHQGAQAHMPEA